MTIKSQDIDALIQIFESSDWDEMHLRIEDIEVFLSTDPDGRMPWASGASVATVPPAAASRTIATNFPTASMNIAAALPAATGRNIATPIPPAAGRATAASSAAPAPGAAQPNWVAVTAPNLGTFYRAPKPGLPSFVEIGQAVDADTEICLIEVMKLFTTLTAGVKGIVRQVCTKDAAMVEFGQTLFYIEPV